MSTQVEKLDYQRRWHKAHRADPEWLARHRTISAERSRESYHRHKNNRTPDQIVNRKRTQREWYLRKRGPLKPKVLPTPARVLHARRMDTQRAKRAAMTAEQRAAAHANKREWMRNERLNNPEKVRARTKRLLERNPSAKLGRNLRTRIWQALHGVAAKAAPTVELIGCSTDDLRKHLESLFLPGMSWANYNFRGWHVDHIKPCAKFDLTDPAQQRECFHYTNLQPLWAHDNQVKYAK